MVFDTLTNTFLFMSQQYEYLYEGYKAVVMLRFPHAALTFLFCHCLGVACKIKALDREKNFFWFHSLILIVITSISGGSAGAMMIGKLPVIIANDMAVPVCCLCWYLLFKLQLQPFLSTFPPQMIMGVGAALFRMNVICNITSAAAATIPTGPYYHIPLVGPIVVGTALGSFALFVPLDKGLSPIEKSFPYNIQLALVCSTLYHLSVHDHRGIFGMSLCKVIGEHNNETARMMVGALQILSAILQIVLGPEASIFNLSKVFLLILQKCRALEKYKKMDWTTGVIAKFLSLSRVAIVLIAAGVHIYISSSAPVQLSSTPIPLSLYNPRISDSLSLSSSLFSSSSGIWSSIKFTKKDFSSL
mmetsp:Transcript_39401/g.40138  ORF Transcript_39401/g.40138 Transcript_39401/m.40138 type:complete len:359 (-) Transcript_39401:199-1275(-)